MAVIHLTENPNWNNSQTHTADNVFIKSTGWVKAYDDGDDDQPVLYPPHRIRRITGDVTHNSSHGRV